jgi:intracellular sulfur oxidation DsrE/DsrF family protein
MFDLPATPRRGFLTRLSAAAAAFALPVSLREVGPRAPVSSSFVVPGEWDNSWMGKLNVQSRQVFDAPSLDEGNAAHYAKNYINGMVHGYGLPADQVRAVVVCRGSALALLLGDDMWKAYKLGERYKVTDPATGSPAVRNLWHTGDPAHEILYEDSVKAIQERGAIMLACNNALNHFASNLSKASGRTQPEVLAELTQGLLPGVIVVPAAVAAINRAQDKGCSYAYAG